jgi:hypothetical protein
MTELKNDSKTSSRNKHATQQRRALIGPQPIPVKVVSARQKEPQIILTHIFLFDLSLKPSKINQNRIRCTE